VRRLGLPAAQIAALQAYVASGKPLIGLRTASHGFKIKNAPDGTYPVPEGVAEWGAFDHEILGGSYSGHEANDLESDVRTVNTEHPITQGLTPTEWHSKGSLYNAAPIAEDAILLQEGTVPGVVEPVTWIREKTEGRGRVFYSSLGFPDDFQEPAFRALLVRAIQWSLGTL
jgi:type 1 glutamine amidotransferase